MVNNHSSKDLIAFLYQKQSDQSSTYEKWKRSWKGEASQVKANSTVILVSQYSPGFISANCESRHGTRGHATAAEILQDPSRIVQLGRGVNLWVTYAHTYLPQAFFEHLLQISVDGALNIFKGASSTSKMRSVDSIYSREIGCWNSKSLTLPVIFFSE